AQLGRRGFSGYMRGIWPHLAPDEKHPDRPAFAIVIDESTEFLASARQEFDLYHRTARRNEPDGSGGLILLLDRCPKTTRSGNCGNCTLVRHGGVTNFNAFGMRELRRPPPVELDCNGEPLRQPRNPLEVFDDFGLGEKIRVGPTTFAARVVEAWGKPIDPDDRLTAELPPFRRDKEDPVTQPYEPAEDVLGHMMKFAFRPVVTWEHAVTAAGKIVTSEELALRVEEKSKGWSKGVVFPVPTCEVPRLRFTDLAALEMIRRHAEAEGVGVVFTGATPGPDDVATLRVVWPGLAGRRHPYPDRKIKQVAVAAVSGHRGAESLVGRDGKLVTAPLEALGFGLVFCPTRKQAEGLFKAVALKQPSARLAVENYEELTTRKTLHAEADPRTFVTYSRGVLGVGANVLGVRHLVLDALAYRAIASFTPGELTRDEFERHQAEERLSLVLQNVGRALRGEEGKTVVLIVLNADAGLLAAVKASPGVVEGSELPPVLAAGADLAALVEEAGRWLAAGGGDWPESAPKPAKAGPKGGRPRGRVSKHPSTLFGAADAAVRAGTGGTVSFRTLCH
ncbi:MAG: hypothetical protein LC745_00285, partial [Planctomycetia bacterium]|nr:hypothetical protein [Planctomycetia bacterium]